MNEPQHIQTLKALEELDATMTQPISPAGAAVKRREVFPAKVIECFNYLIAINYDGRSAVVKQCDVLTAMEDVGIDSNHAIDKKYLDIEDMYRAAGWKVTYEKPMREENFQAFFRFEVPR